MTDALEKLRILTDELPAVPKLGDLKNALEGNNGHATYEIVNGVCHSYLLFESPLISVARTFVSAGGEFPEHLHDEAEYALIFSGSALVRVNGEEKVIGVGECIMLDPKTPHWSQALEDTWFIAITIPRSKDYPKND